MDLYIGFSRPRHKLLPLYSWLIRLVERTPYSHVYVRWYSEKADADVVYQASSLAVNFMSKTVFDDEAKTTEEFKYNITDDQYRRLLHFCITNAGVPYGWKTAIGIGIVMLCKLVGIKIHNPLADGSKTEVCDELVGYILRDVVGDDLKLALEDIGPKAIYEVVKADQAKGLAKTAA